ncbi:hypothetical protein [Paenibacillus dokdonensis]|uniref:hypothetical protein n=1 Tax=Paenibacillus dokdonensis TaxID=2567944 RepID=UPI0010A750C2|nr:hypothetical protein [Paenibacillus dokdonensis]
MKKLLLIILIFSVYIAGCNKKYNVFTVDGNINKISTDNKEICINDTCVNVDNIKEYRLMITLE